MVYIGQYVTEGKERVNKTIVSDVERVRVQSEARYFSTKGMKKKTRGISYNPVLNSTSELQCILCVKYIFFSLIFYFSSEPTVASIHLQHFFLLYVATSHTYSSSLRFSSRRYFQVNLTQQTEKKWKRLSKTSNERFSKKRKNAFIMEFYCIYRYIFIAIEIEFCIEIVPHNFY